jgi:Bacterial archaeo-eukaryotic release factor family 7
MSSSGRYHLKPLLPLLAGDGRFYVLALSQNEVRLLGASRYSTDEVKLGDDVPESLADALKLDEPEKQLQFHTGSSGDGGAGRSAVFHGHGAKDDSKDNILRYFRKIDRGLRDVLKGQEAPLVVAGVDYLLPIYREANTYSGLVEEGTTGNPEELSVEELHAMQNNNGKGCVGHRVDLKGV